MSLVASLLSLRCSVISNCLALPYCLTSHGFPSQQRPRLYPRPRQRPRRSVRRQARSRRRQRQRAPPVGPVPARWRQQPPARPATRALLPRLGRRQPRGANEIGVDSPADQPAPRPEPPCDALDAGTINLELGFVAAPPRRLDVAHPVAPMGHQDHRRRPRADSCCPPGRIHRHSLACRRASADPSHCPSLDRDALDRRLQPPPGRRGYGQRPRRYGQDACRFALPFPRRPARPAPSPWSLRQASTSCAAAVPCFATNTATTTALTCGYPGFGRRRARGEHTGTSRTIRMPLSKPWRA